MIPNMAPNDTTRRAVGLPPAVPRSQRAELPLTQAPEAAPRLLVQKAATLRHMSRFRLGSLLLTRFIAKGPEQ